MAEATVAGGGCRSGTVTETETETEVTEPENRSLTIKLRKRKPDKKVEWSSDTVDNEHLGRRSSKCCCIYEKPRAFGESSTESEDEDDEGCGNAHCIRGHKKGQVMRREWEAWIQGPWLEEGVQVLRSAACMQPILGRNIAAE
ncbi:protein phosphatase 1 regulatory subunit 11 [Alligator mississippiensis]|uniref:E3 ubiquitin-protein ligase PPP1R11 n=1 Tax=Alligator mississippiensis TaxID=8496 RepID=A0A151M5P8_ALLMI|nr:protein phosphatase 1 regulatory subunit 11 [Alligator mississippiensis]